MSRFFIDRPIFATVLAIVVCLAGILAIFTLPLAQYPDIAPPTITVSATYQGADAKTTQNSVTQIIEQSMTGLDHLLYISSTSSSSGQARIRLTFAPGTNPDIAQVQIQNKLQSVMARLPSSVQRRGVRTYKSGGDFFMVLALYSTDGSMNEADIGNYIDNTLTDPLSRISGISEVRSFTSGYALRIWLNPAKLDKYHLMPSDVRAAVVAQNSDVSAGELGGLPQAAGQQLNATITVRSRLTSVDQFKDIILKSNPDGSVVRLSDVAKVEIGSDSYSGTTFYNGHPSAGMVLELTAGANAVGTERRVKEKLDQLSRFFPPGLEARVAFDTTPFVRASVTEVVKTLIEAIILVVAIMFIFLQTWRATLIPAMAVPVVLLGTFGLLALFGYSINTLTLFALVLSIGLLVDDAIVVVENVERVMAEQKLSPREATIQSMSEIQGALVGIALVLSAVFIPMAFFPGSTGVIYRQFAVTITSAMGLSICVALILTPALCASLLKPYDQRKPPSRVFTALNRGLQATGRAAQHAARYLIHARVLVILVLAGIMLLIGWLFTHLPESFLPTEDQGVLMVTIQLPTGATAQRTEKVVRQVNQYFGSLPNVDSIFAIGASRGQQNTGRAFVHLINWKQRTGDHSSAAEIAARATAALSKIRDARIFVLQPPALRGVGNSSGFQMELENLGGLDDEEFAAARDQFLKLARADSKLSQVRAETTQPNAQFAINIDDAKAHALGLSTADIDSTLSAAFGGAYIDDFIYQGRIKRVYMQGGTPYRMQPEDINDWYVRNSSGQMVPFSAFSTSHWVLGEPALERYNGSAAYEISGQPAPGVSTSEAMTEVAQLVKQLPPGVGFEWSGISYQQKKSGHQAPLLYTISIGFVFLCLAALYESWSIPFAVILVVPLGVLGALLAVLLRGLPIDVYFQIGLLTTIGLSAKNAILVAEYAHQLEQAGESLVSAALHALRMRLRPILMTSLAFGIGVFPLVISTGAGAGARHSVGTGVFGGVIAATLLVILFVPAFFILSRAGWRRLNSEGRIAK